MEGQFNRKYCMKRLIAASKHTPRSEVFNEDKLTHARPLLKNLNALNVYQINIFQILILMYKVKNNTTPKAITKLFHRIQNKYNTKSSTDNFSVPKTVSKTTNFAISNRGPTLWNKTTQYN